MSDRDYDPRMALTLRDVEKYLVIPRHHALTIWKFPVIYVHPAGSILLKEKTE